MNPSSSRGMIRFQQEQMMYDEEYEDYRGPMQTQQQKGEKGKETGRPRRTRQLLTYRPDVMMRTAQMYEYKEGASDGLILEEDGEEEEDVYEEMDLDEDEAYETGVVNEPRQTYHSPNVVNKPSNGLNLSRCSLCGRFHTPKEQYFRWPREEEKRRKWCGIFGLDYDTHHSSFDSSFICSFHFVGKSGTGIRQKQQRDISIKFRPSKYKVANSTKNRHPVAIISSISRQCQYEFSFTRKSAIDGTLFYSCLHCRRAKKDTGLRDTIRTIHLNGNKLVSHDDPLNGHHHACSPIPIKSLLYHMDAELDSDPREEIVNKKQYRLVEGELEESDKNELNADGRIIYVDDSNAFASSSGAVVEVEAVDELWTTTNDDESTVEHHTVDELHTNIGDELLLDGPSSHHNWVEYSKVDNMNGQWKEVEEGNGKNVQKRIVKKYRTPHHVPYPNVSLACPICTYRFPTTPKLIKHLEEHERNGGMCGVCRRRIDPALIHLLRRYGMCPTCKFPS